MEMMGHRGGLDGVGVVARLKTESWGGYGLYIGSKRMDGSACSFMGLRCGLVYFHASVYCLGSGCFYLGHGAYLSLQNIIGRSSLCLLGCQPMKSIGYCLAQ